MIKRELLTNFIEENKDAETIKELAERFKMAHGPKESIRSLRRRYFGNIKRGLPIPGEEGYVWESGRSYKKNKEEGSNLKRSSMLEENKISETTTQESKAFEYNGTQAITNEAQAIEFFKVDMNVWETDKMVTNSWDVTMRGPLDVPVKRTNYQMKIWFKKKDYSIDFEELKEKALELISLRPKISPNLIETHINTGVAVITDIHIGAKTTRNRGTIKTMDYDLNTIVDTLNQVAAQINEHHYNEVHLCILGDIIESLLGLNHINSWQSMEQDVWQGNAIIFAYEILRDFIEHIDNISNVYIVAGNHDRASDRNDQDVSGTVAKVIAYMLQRDIDVRFHPLVISQDIDNIQYIMMHGHMGANRKQGALTKIVLDYGDQNRYNVLMSGHWHQRSGKRILEPIEEATVGLESTNYRQVTIAPIFTGNFYSESLGFASYPGFSIFEKNKKGDNVNHFDYSIRSDKKVK